jgi:hypothetical protein
MMEAARTSETSINVYQTTRKKSIFSVVTKSVVINLFQTWGHIHPLLSTRGPQGDKLGQFIETP